MAISTLYLTGFEHGFVGTAATAGTGLLRHRHRRRLLGQHDDAAQRQLLRPDRRSRQYGYEDREGVHRLERS